MLIIILPYILLFVLGASLTSFMIAQIYRIENDVTYPDFIKKPSSCEKCGKKLEWHELIPIISYIIHKGKCSECDYKVPITYPIFEVTLGISYIILYYFTASIDLYLIVTAMYFLALYDFYHKGFPKLIMNVLLVLGGIYFIVKMSMDFNIVTAYAGVTSMIIAFVVVILNTFKKSFGIGDILVFLFLGMTLALNQLVATLFLSVIFGGVTAIYLLATKKVRRGSYIPFVPFVYLGLVFSFFIIPTVDRYFDYIAWLW